MLNTSCRSCADNSPMRSSFVDHDILSLCTVIVSLLRSIYLPALRSTIITRFVATTADSASVALHLSLMLLGTCALATTFLVGDITDFPVLSTYLYWLADVHNPGWRHSDSVSIEHSEHLLPAMFGNISAPTSSVLRGYCVYFRFGFAQFRCLRLSPFVSYGAPRLATW